MRAIHILWDKHDQTKIEHFRLKVRYLQYVNRNLLAYVQQDYDLSTIQIFL